MSNLPDNIQQAFVGMFEKVPQRILWKYNGKTIYLPKNVMTKKWLPQRDILRK
jgi:glucuronosyltransferase